MEPTLFSNDVAHLHLYEERLQSKGVENAKGPMVIIEVKNYITNNAARFDVNKVMCPRKKTIPRNHLTVNKLVEIREFCSYLLVYEYGRKIGTTLHFARGSKSHNFFATFTSLDVHR